MLFYTPFLRSQQPPSGLELPPIATPQTKLKVYAAIERPVSLLVFTAWQLAVGGIVLLPIALVIEGPITHLSATNLLGFIYLGLVGTGLAYALWFRGMFMDVVSLRQLRTTE